MLCLLQVVLVRFAGCGSDTYYKWYNNVLLMAAAINRIRMLQMAALCGQVCNVLRRITQEAPC